ncbi:hypothetical protein [Candidatus Vidania fulgoroideorum]
MFFSLIGINVKNSLSPVIYKYFFLKSNSKINYKKISIPYKNIYLIIYYLRKNIISNITIPYKKKLIKFCNYISKNSYYSNSLNLIILKKNSLYGYNTDGSGFLKNFTKINFLKPLKIFLIGTGGAGRSIFNLLKRKFIIEKIIIYNRTLINTKKFIKLFNISKISRLYTLNKKKKIKNYILINTIPEIYVKKIIKKLIFKKCISYNINYKIHNSLDNDGVKMLYYQASESFKIFLNER